MNSPRSTVNFSYGFYDKRFFKKLLKFSQTKKLKKYDHQIRHIRLSIDPLKNKLSTFLGEKYTPQIYSAFFSKPVFQAKRRIGTPRSKNPMQGSDRLLLDSGFRNSHRMPSVGESYQIPLKTTNRMPLSRKPIGYYCR